MGAMNYQMFIEIICLLSWINQLLFFFFFFFAFLWQKAGKEKSRLSVFMSVVHFHPHIFLSKITAVCFFLIFKIFLLWKILDIP